jgi:hypothetical protein
VNTLREIRRLARLTAEWLVGWLLIEGHFLFCDRTELHEHRYGRFTIYHIPPEES